MTTVADTLGELDTRLGRVAADYIEAAHAKSFWAKVRRISVDQTSSRWGPSLCHQCAYLSAMVKAVEDTVRVNYFTFLDCLEGTLRRVELGQDSRDRAGAASICGSEPIFLRRTAGLLGAGHGGRHLVAIAADAACLRRNDNGRL